jgi:NAD(P)-dependent dehydrogenase (short-subunit alcohol dehydrogenase family)
MPADSKQLALIVGAGSGLSASLARQCAAAGMRVALAARNTEKLKSFSGARLYSCDAAEPAQVAKLFEALDRDEGAPDLVVYNPSYPARGPFVTLDTEEVKRALLVTAYGGFLVAQAAAKRMLERGSGSIFFTGASASLKGYAESAPFAMGKFALRGLAQSIARELGPKGIHVAHFVIDGGIAKAGGDPRAAARGEDGMLHPDAIAETYLNTYRQHRSAWSFEVDLRPWIERF